MSIYHTLGFNWHALEGASKKDVSQAFAIYWCRISCFFHHFHLNSASCWWDSYWTLHPRGSRPSPHNVVRCAELSTLTNWNALFPHFHRSLTLACQPHSSSQYSHRIIESISKQLTLSTLFSGWTSFYVKILQESSRNRLLLSNLRYFP